MRLSVRVFNSLGLMVISAWMVITALKWEFKCLLFPITVGIPVFFLACSEFYSSLFGRELSETEKEARIDFKLYEDADKALVNRRTLLISSWILIFFFLILFVGFQIAIPLFFILYLKFEGKEKLGISVGMAAFAWASFYGLFVWLLNTPMLEGWLQKWLRSFGIG